MLHARATEVLVWNRLVAAAALAVHIGAVVIDAPMPTSQPAEEAQSAGRDSGKHG
jgi:hypothetical protein